MPNLPHEINVAPKDIPDAALVQAIRRAVREEIQSVGHPCVCNLSSDAQRELGHLVGMFRDVGIEAARDRLRFVGSVQDGVSHAKKAGIATAVGLIVTALVAGLVLLFQSRTTGG